MYPESITYFRLNLHTLTQSESLDLRNIIKIFGLLDVSIPQRGSQPNRLKKTFTDAFGMSSAAGDNKF